MQRSVRDPAVRLVCGSVVALRKGPPTNKLSDLSDIRAGHRVAIVQSIPRRALTPVALNIHGLIAGQPVVPVRENNSGKACSACP